MLFLHSNYCNYIITIVLYKGPGLGDKNSEQLVESLSKHEY